MTSLLVTLLTGVLVIDCLILIFLILMQLPKKEAGLGQAFGGAATDALFGAGSGNVLTNATKYAAGIFFVLALGLSLMTSSSSSHRRASELEEQLNRSQTPLQAPAPAPKPAVPTVSASNAPLSLTTSRPAADTNAPLQLK